MLCQSSTTGYTVSMELFFIFLFGLAIGSFCNVVIYRLAHGGSIAFDRSRCPHCGYTLFWYELIPLVSFAIQGGKCRRCHAPISGQYPLVEAATGILFAYIYYFLPSHYHGWEMGYLFFVFSSLLVIFVFDLTYYIIPNVVLYPLIGVVVLHLLFGESPFPVAYPVISAGAVSGFFFLLYLVSRGRWIGFGDVKYGIFMGLFLGFPLTAVAWFFSYLFGAVIGGILIAMQRKGIKSEVPFGPFLIVGTSIAYFFGRGIIQWYLGIF